nr:hypothetical protein [Tanacetum cinerariifolium]GFA94106.1 hypothetical protein [Tanacetum cinerariifolium]
MASAVICLSKGQRFNFLKYIFDSLVHNVDSSSKFYMYPRFLQLIIQNQVGDLSTHTTRFISPALTQKVFANMRRVGKGFSGVKTPLFEGMLAVRKTADEEVAEAQVQIDVAVAAVVEENVAEDRVEHLENDNVAQKLVIIKLKARVKRLENANMVKSSKLRRLRKVEASRTVESSVDIEDVFNQGRIIDDMDMDEGIELVKDAEEVVEVVTTAKLITEVVIAAALQVSAASVTIPTAKPAEDLRKHLEVVEDEDDDVFVEATPLASKVPVMDYQTVLIDNKPRFKIIKANETHQLYISFTTLLKNFDREDLESLWRIVKDRFSTSKPTNFLDEYLLLTLKTMFKEPDGQDAIWRNQKSVHGLTLVKR